LDYSFYQRIPVNGKKNYYNYGKSVYIAFRRNASRAEPKGLAAERAWYLYKHIREYVSDDSKGITCPKPTVPKPKSLEILKHERNKSDD
jgi:hypothetical protein